MTFNAKSWVIAAGVSMSLVAQSFGSIIYSTSFESPDFSVGGVSGQNGWSGYAGAVIQSGEAKTGSQAIELLSTGALVVATKTGAYSGKLRFDMQVYTPSVKGSVSSFYFALGNANRNIFNVTFKPDTNAATGVLSVYLRGTGAQYFTLTGPEYAFSNDAWNRLTVDYNTVTGDVDIFLNDLFNSSGQGLKVTSVESIDRATINWGHNDSSQTAFVDDYSISVIPEPSTTALIFLLGSGLALKLGGRRFASGKNAQRDCAMSSR